MPAAEDATGAPAEGRASPTSRFVGAGLEQLGLAAAEDELAVIEAVDAIYRPLIRALLDAELEGIDPEPGADMSSAPRHLESR